MGISLSTYGSEKDVGPEVAGYSPSILSVTYNVNQFISTSAVDLVSEKK